jgi:hypothetical protein
MLLVWALIGARTSIPRTARAAFGFQPWGHGWTEIARALGTKPDEARLRFDPESPSAEGRWPLRLLTPEKGKVAANPVDHWTTATHG